MGTKTPTVWEDLRRGTAPLDGRLHLDTPAWFTWLEDATTRSFASPLYNTAQGYSEATLDGVAKALNRFETYARFRDFAFHIEQAKGFKAHLSKQQSLRSKDPLSKAAAWRLFCGRPLGLMRSRPRHQDTPASGNKKSPD